MYWQSVLVWNLPFHLAIYMILIYFGTFYGDWLLNHISFFQFMGALLFLLVVVSEIRKAYVKAFGEREFSENNWLVWPEDATTYSAETYPLSGKTFFGKVKLYSFDRMLEILAEFALHLKKANLALRALRYTNPTQFAFNTIVVCGVGIILTSYFEARVNLLVLLYAAILAPGVFRRKIPGKITMKLEETPKGRKLVQAISIGENPNLEETNTAKLFSFGKWEFLFWFRNFFQKCFFLVNSVDVHKKTAQKIVMTEIIQKKKLGKGKSVMLN